MRFGINIGPISNILCSQSLNVISKKTAYISQIAWGFLLKCCNFILSMDKWLHPQGSVGWNYLSIPNFDAKRLPPWSFRMDKFTQNFIMDVITYPCWGKVNPC